MRRITIGLGALLLLACSGTTESTECPAGGEPGEVTSLVVDQIGQTEGIAFSPAGKLYVAGPDGVWEVKADGHTVKLAAVPKPVGMVWWKDALYVASGNETDAKGTGAIWKVTEAGSASAFATGIDAPNFLAVTPWGSLLVANDHANNEVIREVSATGVATDWSTAVKSANGLAFDASGTSLFVLTTFTTPVALWKIPVTGGTAGPASTLATWPDGAGDGLAIGVDGAIYSVLNAHGRVDRTVGAVTEPFAEGMPTVASLAFGEGAFDPCSMYATSLRIGTTTDVFRIRVGTRGLALRR